MNEYLTVADLKPGDRFIFKPLPGDNSGHGGFKGPQRVFVRIEPRVPAGPPLQYAEGYLEYAVRNSDGVPTSGYGTAEVIPLAW